MQAYLNNVRGPYNVQNVRNESQRSSDQNQTQSGSPSMAYNYAPGPRNMGYQNQNLGRYVPPMMSNPNANQWYNQGGYNYNLPNNYGPYQNAVFNGNQPMFMGGGQQYISPYMFANQQGNQQQFTNPQNLDQSYRQRLMDFMAQMPRNGIPNRQGLDSTVVPGRDNSNREQFRNDRLTSDQVAQFRNDMPNMNPTQGPQNGMQQMGQMNRPQPQMMNGFVNGRPINNGGSQVPPGQLPAVPAGQNASWGNIPLSTRLALGMGY